MSRNASLLKHNIASNAWRRATLFQSAKLIHVGSDRRTIISYFMVLKPLTQSGKKRLAQKTSQVT